MNSKIGNLRCMQYIEKKPTQYQPLKTFWAYNDQSQILKCSQKKNECLGELEESIPQITASGLTVFLVKKDCKIKHGFKDSISIVDLSSAANQPINLKLCETLVLLNHSNNITRN